MFETVILKPMVSEKSFGMLETENKLVFLVRRQATKGRIKNDLEALYDVKVDIALNPKIYTEWFKIIFDKFYEHINVTNESSS